MIAKGLINFVLAQVRNVAHGCPKCTEQEIADRLAVCEACEHFTGTACKICLCNCCNKPTLLNKLYLATERCPLGKWSYGASYISTSTD